MFIHSFGKRPIVEESQKINASVCMRNYLLDRPSGSIFKLDLSVEEDIKGLIEEMEKGITLNLKQEKSGKFEFTKQNPVKFSYTRSNLGKGFIFWFICNVCGSRVKYLYFPPNSRVLACRTCHRLTYDRQNESKKFRPFRRLFGV